MVFILFNKVNDSFIIFSQKTESFTRPLYFHFQFNFMSYRKPESVTFCSIVSPVYSEIAQELCISNGSTYVICLRFFLFNGCIIYRVCTSCYNSLSWPLFSTFQSFPADDFLPYNWSSWKLTLCTTFILFLLFKSLRT